MSCLVITVIFFDKILSIKINNIRNIQSKNTDLTYPFVIFPLAFVLTVFYRLKVSTVVFEEHTAECCSNVFTLTLNRQRTESLNHNGDHGKKGIKGLLKTGLHQLN